MNKNSRKAVSPRIDQSVADFFSQRFESLNAGVTLAIETYPTNYSRTLAELRGMLNKEQLTMCIDVMNATALTARMPGDTLYANMEDSFTLYPEVFEAKYGIQQKETMSRLNDLTNFQLATLEVWSWLFWQQDHNQLEKYLEVLV